MLNTIRSNRRVQLIVGLGLGILFGFFLQRSGVTHYDVILGQLLLTDFTVIKIMLSAIVTGMLIVYTLKSLGLVQLHPKPGSLGTTIVGGLIFGVAFAVLGFCPGTIAGAVGQGSLDALIGGTVGILLGSGLFAAAYPKLQKPILMKGDFGMLKVNAWVVVVPAAILLTAILLLLESAGL